MPIPFAALFLVSTAICAVGQFLIAGGVFVSQCRAHGQRDMPIWGERYAREMIQKEGEFGSMSSAYSLTQARVLELVFYLATFKEQFC